MKYFITIDKVITYRPGYYTDTNDQIFTEKELESPPDELQQYALRLEVAKKAFAHYLKEIELLTADREAHLQTLTNDVNGVTKVNDELKSKLETARELVLELWNRLEQKPPLNLCVAVHDILNDKPSKG